LSKAGDKKKDPETSKLLGVLLGALLLTMCAYLVHGFYQIQDIKKEVRIVKNNYRHIKIRQNDRIEKERQASSRDKIRQQRQIKDIQHTLKKQQEQAVANKQDTVQSNQKLKQKIDALEDAYRRLNNRVAYLNRLFLSHGLETTNNRSADFAYFQDSKWYSQRDEYIEDVRNTDILTWTIFDGRGGVDTWSSSNSLYATVDGIFERSIEVFDFLNGRYDKIYVFAPAFLNLEDDELTIKGDHAIDEVVLDGCLKWQKREDGKGFNAIDSRGQSKVLLVSDNLKIVQAQTCNSDYTALNAIIRTAQVYEKPKQDSQKPKNVTLRIDNIGSAEQIRIYRSWLDHVENPSVEQNLLLLIMAMEQKVLPTLFPRTVRGNSNNVFLLEPLNFNTQNFPATKVTQSGTCADALRQLESEILVNSSKTDLKITCPRGDQFYSLTDADEEIDDSWDNDIVFPAKGRDRIDLGWGQDIVFLSNNWGEKTITKTCHNTEPVANKLYYTELSSNSYIGMGFSIRKTDEFIFINDVFEDGPAAKAGLRKGDRIYRINNRDVGRMRVDQVLSILKGSRPEYVMIDYYSYENSKRKTVRVRKDITAMPKNVKFSDAHKFKNAKKVSSEWPFQYNSFIVFGPDVREDDIEIVKEGQLRHKLSGDTVNYSRCFNLIYMSRTDQ